MTFSQSQPNFISQQEVSQMAMTYSWSQVMDIANDIRKKYFWKSSKVMNCDVRINTRLRNRTLGRASIYKGYIELNPRLMNGREPNKLHQVIYHEFVQLVILCKFMY